VWHGPDRYRVTAGAVIALSLGVAEADDDAATWTADIGLRERATSQTAIRFDADDPNAGWFWTQRLSAAFEGPVSESVTARVSLVSALQEGMSASRIMDNNLDVQEAWVGWRANDVEFRVGRQELYFGTQRLIGSREGTNVRRTFEGVRALGKAGRWQWDAFGVRLVNVEPNGAFNDSSNSDSGMAGLYLTRKGGVTDLDVYYLYTSRNDRVTVIGTADQRRHSFGVRAFGDAGRWFWDWEAVAQSGRHGSADVAAWTLATNTGYRLPGSWSPRLTLSANVASGDSDPDDNTLGTFDAPYPRGNPFSVIALLGPANYVNLNPRIAIAPTENFRAELSLNALWRMETNDGVYRPPITLFRRPEGSGERFVNSVASLLLRWRFNDVWSARLALAHSRPERFIRETGPADIVNFAEFTLWARF